MSTWRYSAYGHKKAPKLICLEAFVSISIKSCDPAGTRTQGPIIKSDVLYQLSYEINLFRFFKRGAKIRERRFNAKLFCTKFSIICCNYLSYIQLCIITP